jgi:hypothetical protein
MHHRARSACSARSSLWCSCWAGSPRPSRRSWAPPSNGRWHPSGSPTAARASRSAATARVSLGRPSRRGLARCSRGKHTSLPLAPGIRSSPSTRGPWRVSPMPRASSRRRDVVDSSTQTRRTRPHAKTGQARGPCRLSSAGTRSQTEINGSISGSPAIRAPSSIWGTFSTSEGAGSH